jgi:rod shape-determining protein MreC
MDLLLNRYRNVAVLLAVVFAQLILLAYQVRANQQVRLLRVWAVTIVAPMARLLENGRSSVHSFFSDYFILLDVREENRRIKAENNRLKLENNFLRTELSTADRARALIEFKGRSPSKTAAARIISTSTSGKTVVMVDRGTSDGVLKGMAVITGDGIVGKVIDSFPMAAQVQLITDSLFGAGVVSEKNRVYGTLRGTGHNRCQVDKVQNEEKVENGEMFYTTGEDRIFPKGLPVGRVVSVQAGPTFKQIEVVPAGLMNGLFEEVLIVLEGAHQEIPMPSQSGDRIIVNPPPPEPSAPDGSKVPAGTPSTGVLTTDADRMLDRYRKVEQQRGSQFGTFGTAPPSFQSLPGAAASPPPSAGATPPGATPPRPPANEVKPPAAKPAVPDPKPAAPAEAKPPAPKPAVN